MKVASDGQVSEFASIIGQGVVDFIKEKGLVLNYYSFQGEDKHYAVVCKGKALLCPSRTLRR